MKHDYKDYKGLIFHLAGRYHPNIHGMSLDELISEGNLEFVRCQPDFDPAKNTKFSSYLYIRLRGAYKNAQRKRGNEKRRIAYELLAIPIEIETRTPESRCLFKEAIKGLSSDAKEIIKIVFETPMDLVGMLPKKQPRGLNKSQIGKYMRSQGWGFPRISKAFAEIKEIF